MTRAVLSIGGNLGDPASALQSVVDALRPWLVAVSPVYRSAAWGPVEQPDFLNAIVIVDDPDAAAIDWLARGQALEVAAERVRDIRWGPRTLDVDVIDVDAINSTDPTLTLPHPRAAERAFVLVPWLAVDPLARLLGVPVADRVAALAETEVDEVRLAPEVRLS
jgi:2-amino-4-hydroxy-6-hydroxymethyldihydropteridine diphosphokinase